MLEATFREYWGRLLALLAARFRRLDLAEDGLADAFTAAAAHWPANGTPANPPAWLLTTARRHIIDRLRSETVAVRKEPLLLVDAEARAAAQRCLDDPDADLRIDPGGSVPDERLRLIFVCTDPRLSTESAAALTLRLVLGVSTRDLARLFLVSDAAMSARLTRAKRLLTEAGAPFAVPTAAELPERLAALTAVVYLAFTAGYAPASGPDVTRTELAGEAVRLLRVLRELLPGPELDALLALMLLQHARRDARTDDRGRLVLLPDQDRTRWRADEIRAGLALVDRLDGAEVSGLLGDYLLQARIAAEHARATTAAQTRWDRIATHYAELEMLTGSPVVRLNRAVAVSQADGAEAGLAMLEGLDEELTRNHRLAGVRARLLAELGRTAEARAAYERALGWCRNAPESAELRRQLDALPGPDRQD